MPESSPDYGAAIDRANRSIEQLQKLDATTIHALDAVSLSDWIDWVETEIDDMTRHNHMSIPNEGAGKKETATLSNEMKERVDRARQKLELLRAELLERSK